MKKYLAVALLLMVGCTSRNSDHDQIRIFLTEWSKALTTRNESLRGFYEAQFVFPKVLFDAPENIQVSFDLDHIEIATAEENKDIKVTVPFSVTGVDGITSEPDNIILTITKTKNGFLIRDMSQALAVQMKEHSLRLQLSTEAPERRLRYDSIIGGIRAIAATLSKHYDSVVFYTEVDDQKLFYVINGSWEFPYGWEKQRDGGNYKMGVVTAENKVVIPVAYSKIYNPDGGFPGMIEVEDQGLRGLFNVTGGVSIPAEYDGLYPTAISGAIVQVRKGESYGWADSRGKVSFDPASHTNKKLFQSPMENQSILEWEFTYPGPVKLLVDLYQDPGESTGIIIYPSFLRDLGITSIANGGVLLESSEFGMGTTDTEIKFEKVEMLSDQLFGLISFFMEAGADARGYHSETNDLLVVDKSLSTVDHLESLASNNFGQDPCDGHPTYKTIESGLYESEDGHGAHKYYKVSPEGSIEELATVREFNFTKFVKIDENYFDRCYYESFEYTGDYEEGKPNMVVVTGVSTEDLDIMRNEIYAEYGFIFKSQKWKTYFEAKPWYKPQYDNVDQFLTETDKHNVKFILEYQRMHKNQEVQRDSIQFMWAG